jgi:hypothetical protein
MRRAASTTKSVKSTLSGFCRGRRSDISIEVLPFSGVVGGESPGIEMQLVLSTVQRRQGFVSRSMSFPDGGSDSGLCQDVQQLSYPRSADRQWQRLIVSTLFFTYLWHVDEKDLSIRERRGM